MQDSNVTNPSGIAENEHASGLASTHFSVPWIPLALMTFAGLILGAIGYFGAAIILEGRRMESEPVMSYGQQAGLVSAPLCAIMCAMMGMSFCLVVGKQRLLGTLLLVANGCVGGLVVNSIWSEQIAQHGRDYSETVLYYPPMSVAFASLLFAVSVGFFALMRR